jgi:hypothetical protein
MTQRLATWLLPSLCLFGLVAQAAPPVPPKTPPAGAKLPGPAAKALESATALLAKATGGDARLLACMDALPFLNIVLEQVPDHPVAVPLGGECRYLTEDYAGAVPLLERTLIQFKKARQKDKASAEKAETAELRLLKAKTTLAERKAAAEKAEAERLAAEQAAKTAAEEAQKAAQDEAKRVEAERLEAERKASEAAELERRRITKEVALRGGFAPEAGVLGVSAEFRFGRVGLAVGSGGYPVGAALRYLHPVGPGFVYVAAHGIVVGPSLVVDRFTTGFGFGGTAGYDWRPVSFLSVKLGAGAGIATGRSLGLVVDASVGPVLSF